jgi:hypothetical protein
MAESAVTADSPWLVNSVLSYLPLTLYCNLLSTFEPLCTTEPAIYDTFCQVSCFLGLPNDGLLWQNAP